MLTAAGRGNGVQLWGSKRTWRLGVCRALRHGDRVTTWSASPSLHPHVLRQPLATLLWEETM